MKRLLGPVFALALVLGAGPARAADYAGPLIDAHGHVPSPSAIDAYVAAMKRHDVRRVLLLGVGGVQKDDPAWIAAAALKYPALILPAIPVPDPMAGDAGARIEAAVARGKARALGEIHVRQVSRKIDRDPSSPAFGQVLAVAAKHGLPVVVHDELDEAASRKLGNALDAHPRVVMVLAHAGEAPPGRIAALLARHANLMVDLSGMHFQRTPALATESGPLDPAWKALLEKMPDRFVMGIDAWAPRLFEPAMLDRLMKWTRRILGELAPSAAEQIAYKNAARLYRTEP